MLLAYNEKLQEELRNGVIRNALLENKGVVDLTNLEIDNTMQTHADRYQTNVCESKTTSLKRHQWRRL